MSGAVSMNLPWAVRCTMGGEMPLTIQRVEFNDDEEYARRRRRGTRKLYTLAQP
jgi:hypothetical protein